MDEKMIKKAIKLVIYGFGLGIVIGFLAYYLTDGRFADSRAAFLDNISFLELLAGGIQGAVCMGTTIVYDIEEWSIMKATVIHFIICMVCFTILAIIQGWFDLQNMVFWISIIIAIIVYFIIWLVMYKRYKSEVRKMNEGLKNIK